MSVRRTYWFGAGLFLLLALGACSTETEQMHRLLGKADNCDAANETCRISAEGISVSLTLGPDVKPLVMFPINLTFEGSGRISPDVVVDFQMQDMDMGVNRYRLQPSSPSVWEGEAMLPVCTVSRMDWIVIVEFMLDEQPYKLIYPFHSETN